MILLNNTRNTILTISMMLVTLPVFSASFLFSPHSYWGNEIRPFRSAPDLRIPRLYHEAKLDDRLKQTFKKDRFLQSCYASSSSSDDYSHTHEEELTSQKQTILMDRRASLVRFTAMAAIATTTFSNAQKSLAIDDESMGEEQAVTEKKSKKKRDLDEDLRSNFDDDAGGEITLMASPLLSPPPGSKTRVISSEPSLTKRVSKIADPRYFIAGGTCAAISHGLATPFDVVKTRIQADPEEFQDLGLLESVQKIISTDNTAEGDAGGGDISVLLSGLGPTVVGYFVEGAFKFGIYEALKPVMISLLSGGLVGAAVAATTVPAPTSTSTVIPYLLASVTAGASASVFLCPMEDARIKIVTDPEYSEGGMLKALPKLIEQNGVLSAFAGLPAMLTKQVPYTIMKQLSFEFFAGSLYAAVAAASLSAEELKWEVSVCSAFLASILACIASQPGDVLLTETYKGESSAMEGETNENMTIIKHAQIVYQEEGVGGFFAGLKPRFLHVASIITTQLVLYDVIKQSLGLPVTGAH